MKEYFADIMSTLQNSLSSLDEEQFTKLVNDCT